MTINDCALLPLSRIRPTEEICPLRADEVVSMILETQVWTRPICIERSVGALLDGHHRLAAARVLGLTRVPVHVFDYAEVELASWRPDFAPTRDEVLARALSGDLYPHKTTRHTFTARAVEPILITTLIEGGCALPKVRDIALCSAGPMRPPVAAAQAPSAWRRG